MNKQLLNIAVMAFFLTPLLVFLHELAHVGALELAGVEAQLKGFAMGMPVFPPGFSWNFETLRTAQAHYGVGDGAFVFGAIAGPVFTLLVGYAGLCAFRYWKRYLFAVVSLGAIVPRMVNIAFAPKFINGTINTSDEAIAAHFMGWPLWSVFALSMLLFYLCFFFVMKALPEGERFRIFLAALVGGLIGFFTIDTLVNIYVFHLAAWAH